MELPEKIDHIEIITQDWFVTKFQVLFENLSPWESHICLPLNFLFHYQACVIIYKNKKAGFRKETQARVTHKGNTCESFYLGVLIHYFMVLTEGICLNEEIYSSMGKELKWGASVFASLVNVCEVPKFFGEYSHHKISVHIEAAATVSTVTPASQMKDDKGGVNSSHHLTVWAIFALGKMTILNKFVGRKEIFLG